MIRILVIGDSWGAGRVADDGTDNGWPLMMGIPPELRQAVDGTTALQWASDVGGMLTRALNTACDCVVISLGGNDAFAIYADKVVTPKEIADASAALAKVVALFVAKGIPVFIMQYANPFRNDWHAWAAVTCINAKIRSASPGATPIESESVLNDASCFNGSDVHTTCEGNRRLAGLITDLTNQTTNKGTTP